MWIAVFGHILSGKFDPVVLRYIVLMAELVNCVSWQLAVDFQMFISIVYSLQEDEVETMMMGYLGLNERCISKTLVMEYILYLILTGAEPLFKKCEANLLQLSGTEPGYLSSAEFELAIETIAPVCNTKVSHVLVEQSIATKQSVSISLSSAAQITSYLILLQQLKLHLEHLHAQPASAELLRFEKGNNGFLEQKVSRAFVQQKMQGEDVSLQDGVDLDWGRELTTRGTSMENEQTGKQPYQQLQLQKWFC
ncbi:uncharacterized protein LOC132379723 [Hypanus sabinus]|uniref:uncharacterized protein LOC132379723 n=1 Tax=Hypanus sabinus TaxID=79690 RepID=UPI0028C4A537|nr:uncharacterized protein LOC132379723 [Hypanus sabinus]